MLEPAELNRIKKFIPMLQSGEPELLLEFERAAYFARIPSGRDIFIEGDEVDAIALLVSGAVRVFRVGANGREITLYRFGEGESCILTANAILNHQSFPAIATVERDAEAVMIPAEIFNDWMRRYDTWREFVYDLLSQRLSSVMEIVDQVAFQRMDRRVAALLLNSVDPQNRVGITHQAIADELGSSREVISRLLEDFAERGIVRLSRGEIEVLQKDELAALQTL